MFVLAEGIGYQEIGNKNNDNHNPQGSIALQSKIDITVGFKIFYRKVASRRTVYYSILNSFGQSENL